MSLNESIVEDAALTWFGELGYAVGHGPQLAPGEPAADRDSFGEVVLVGRLREAIRRLNPTIPEEAREEALRKVLRVATTSLVQTNRAFHRMLRDGVDVEYPRPDGSIKGDKARLVDFADVRANDWFVVNQFTVIEAQHNRRPDVVVFVNGLPLALIELKNAADEDATIWSAYAQLQTYKAEVPSLLHYNAVPVDARWPQLQSRAKLPSIGKDVDDAMVAIERDNPRLKGALNKNYGRADLDKHRLGELIDLIGSIQLVDAGKKSKDLLGQVFMYFLRQFASAEGKNGGQFYTPECVVGLLVEMLAPCKGRVYDPCGGSGGMFVQSEKFVEFHGGPANCEIRSAKSERRLPSPFDIRNSAFDILTGPENAPTFRRDLSIAFQSPTPFLKAA